MAIGFEEPSSREPQGPSCPPGSSSNDARSFECNICFELAQDPIVTLCGHLFCWPCLYKWLHLRAHSPECPVCKAFVEELRLVPLYGRGKTPTDPRSKSVPGPNIPNRPAGQRPATAPPPSPNQFGAHSNPWFMGGAQVATPRFSNYPFSATIGGVLPFLSFQMHGFPDVRGLGPAAARFPHGYYPHLFHGGAHGHRYRQAPQSDVFLKAVLFLVGSLVVAFLFLF